MTSKLRCNINKSELPSNVPKTPAKTTEGPHKPKHEAVQACSEDSGHATGDSRTASARHTTGGVWSLSAKKRIENSGGVSEPT